MKKIFVSVILVTFISNICYAGFEGGVFTTTAKKSITDYYNYDYETISQYDYTVDNYFGGRKDVLNNRVPSFYKFLEKGYLKYCYYQSILKILEQLSNDEQSMANIVKLIDLLTQRYEKQIDNYKFTSIISNLIDTYIPLSQNGFEQVLNNTNLILNNNYGISKKMMFDIYERASVSDLSKPFSQAYFKVIKQLYNDGFENEMDLGYGSMVRDPNRNWAQTIPGVLNHYSNNEKALSAILENYNIMKQDKILTKESVMGIFCSTDWAAYNGKNYALELVKRMEKTGLYSPEEINSWASKDWGYNNEDFSPEALILVDKGYLNYLSYLNENIELNDQFYKNFIKVMDLLKRYNINDDAIISILSFSNWNKGNETYSILTYLLNSGKKSAELEEIFYNSHYYTNIYPIYERVISNNSIYDKQTAFNQELNSNMRKANNTRKRENIGEAIKTTGAVATSPIWLPLVILKGVKN